MPRQQCCQTNESYLLEGRFEDTILSMERYLSSNY